MKIRGRFIGILAVLGLLIALVPLASAGAVTGVVTLTGGEKGQFFSDRANENIVTIQVKDADLTPVRTGTARLAVAGSDRTIDLSALVVSGEIEKTDKLDGATTNGPCMLDLTDDQTENPVDMYHGDCDEDDDGDAEWVTVSSAGVIAAIADGTSTSSVTDTLALRFTLSEVARDRQANGKEGVGVVTEDDITFKKGGRDQALEIDADLDGDLGSGEIPDISGVFYQAVLGDTAISGSGIQYLVAHKMSDANPAARESILAADIANANFTVTYEYSEFGFAAVGGGTLLTDVGTRVRYGGNEVILGVDVDGVTNDDPGYTNADSTATVASASGSQIRVNETTETGGLLIGQVVIRFAYHVQDEEKDLVTLTSASQTSKRLTGIETEADSDIFEVEVAIFSREDLANINTAKGSVTANGGVDGVVQIGELNETDQLGDELYQRVLTTADNLFGEVLAATATAEALFDKLIAGEHGDVLSVTYTDEDPSTTIGKSALVDMQAPTVTLISPTDKLYTDSGVATFEAEVTDDGAGVNASEIAIVSALIPSGDGVAAPIEKGYRVTVASSGVIPEGKHEWFVGVKDKVGNVPPLDDPDTTGNQAPRGAGNIELTDAADERLNPFEFTVDTRAPMILSAKTGLYLKNPGVTGSTGGEEQKDNNRQWVRVIFDLGTGGAPLDPATVGANDFRVDGVAPTDAVINAKAHTDAVKGAAVYLQVGQLDTDARPEVELTGEVDDRAGNTRTEGAIAAAGDGLAPVVSVTPSTDISKDEVTITVVSTERLRVNPTVKLTDVEPTNGVAVEDIAHVDPVLAVSVQTGSQTTWTTTRKEAGVAKKYYVVVRAEDQSDNAAEVGVNASEGDLVTFQLDDLAPSLTFVDAAGEDLKSTKQEEGAVWIVAEFDDDEHGDAGADGKTTDSYRKVEVTALKLTNKDSDEVVTEDVTAVFGAEVDCVDHDTNSARYDEDDPAKNNKCAQRTLAISLTPGMYNIAVTGVDQTGNEVTGNTDFEVTAAEPFELTLRPGQNFISIPGMPMDEGGNIDTLFSDEAISAVSTYDRSRELAGENPWLRSSKDLETGMFSGDITAIEPGKAYFVNSTASVVVKVKLQATGQLPPTIPVRQGFNAIGFWSVSGDENAEIDLYLGSIGWSVAYSYDPTPGRGWEVIRKGDTDPITFEGQEIEAGKGYLVYALYDSVLTP